MPLITKYLKNALIDGVKTLSVNENVL